VPVYWPGGVRRVGGVSPVCRFCMERGKADADTAALAPEGAGGKRERAVRRKPEALSTVAGLAFGPAHSSGEAPVMGAERRSRTVLVKFVRATRGFWEGSSGRAEVEGEAL